jgi:hypothetical protein
MVALQILVLPVQVRILVGQPDRTLKFSIPPEINEFWAVLLLDYPEAYEKTRNKGVFIETFLKDSKKWSRLKATPHLLQLSAVFCTLNYPCSDLPLYRKVKL